MNSVVGRPPTGRFGGAWRAAGILLALALGPACGDEGSTPSPDAGLDAAVILDAAVSDAGSSPDGGATDAGPPDAAPDADAGTPDAGFDGGAGEVGVISGSCGELDDVELLGADPYLFRNAIDFPDGYTEADEARLSDGAREILAEGTAGGSSGLSEAFAFEVLHRCEGAALLQSETEISYEPPDSIKTDMRVDIDGHAIGVSVTRAVAFPFADPYTVERATMLLEDKLADVLVSSANVAPEHEWVKQILHVIAYGSMHADSISTAWSGLDPAVRADTILWITVTDGDDAFLY